MFFKPTLGLKLPNMPKSVNYQFKFLLSETSINSTNVIKRILQEHLHPIRPKAIF